MRTGMLSVCHLDSSDQDIILELHVLTSERTGEVYYAIHYTNKTFYNSIFTFLYPLTICTENKSTFASDRYWSLLEFFRKY